MVLFVVIYAVSMLIVTQTFNLMEKNNSFTKIRHFWGSRSGRWAHIKADGYEEIKMQHVPY